LSNGIVDIKTIILIKTEAMGDPTHDMNALERQKEEKRLESVAKDFCDSLIHTALSWLNKSKEKKSEKKCLPYGKMSKVIQGLSDNGVHVTRNVLNYLLRKYAKSAISSVEEARHKTHIVCY
jgi:hypothetical protein